MFGLVALCLALCLGERANAQAMTVTYSSWPIGFQSDLTVGQNSDAYGNFSGVDGSDARGGNFSYIRTNFPNGWFVGGGESGSLNGLNRAGAFGSSLSFQGTQFGYNFQNTPLTVYAGFDTIKVSPGIGNPFTSFDSASATVPGYRAHAGVEFQAAPNLSLSLGVGYVQQPTLTGSDINSLALGASPFAFGRR